MSSPRHDFHQGADWRRGADLYCCYSRRGKAAVSTAAYQLLPKIYSFNYSFNYFFNTAQLARTRRGVMSANTGRGAHLPTEAALAAMKSAQLGHLGRSGYEYEKDLLCNKYSPQPLQDALLVQLLTRRAAYVQRAAANSGHSRGCFFLLGIICQGA